MQSFLHPAEQIMVSHQHPSLSFAHFVATNFSVFMVDERYPGYPVCLTCYRLYLRVVYATLSVIQFSV